LDDLPMFKKTKKLSIKSFWKIILVTHLLRMKSDLYSGLEWGEVCFSIYWI
jgi:hypothetical protein